MFNLATYNNYYVIRKVAKSVNNIILVSIIKMVSLCAGHGGLVATLAGREVIDCFFFRDD